MWFYATNMPIAFIYMIRDVRFGEHVSQVIIIMDLKDLSFAPNGHAIPLFKLT